MSGAYSASPGRTTFGATSATGSGTAPARDPMSIPPEPNPAAPMNLRRDNAIVQTLSFETSDR
ncbi:hypothetical protein GCM10023319_02310 [Nocardia iowensis]